MWNQTPEGDAFVRELSKGLVEEFAPEELDMFGELYHEYQKDATPPALEPGSDDALGSGLGQVLIAVTPAASAMVTAVVSFIVGEVLKASQDEASEKIKEKVKAVFNPNLAPSAKEKAAPLTPEQLDQVRKLAAKRAVEFGLPPDQSKKMALALVGSLSLQ